MQNQKLHFSRMSSWLTSASNLGRDMLIRSSPTQPSFVREESAGTKDMRLNCVHWEHVWPWCTRRESLLSTPLRKAYLTTRIFPDKSKFTYATEVGPGFTSKFPLILRSPCFWFWRWTWGLELSRQVSVLPQNCVPCSPVLSLHTEARELTAL